MILLEIFSSIFLLLNKILLVANRKATAWVLGIIGMGGLGFFLYLQQTIQVEQPKNLLIMVISNWSGIPIMFYGYVIIVIKKSITLKERLKKWKVGVTLLVIIFSLYLCTSVFLRFLNADLIMEQFVLTLVATLGTLLLSFDVRVASIWGWAFLIPTHMLSGYLMYKLGCPYATAGQALSIPFALYGIMLEIKKK